VTAGQALWLIQNSTLKQNPGDDVHRCGAR